MQKAAHGQAKVVGTRSYRFGPALDTSHGAMKLLLLIVRTYPKRTLLTLLCLVLAGLAEGIGMFI